MEFKSNCWSSYGIVPHVPYASPYISRVYFLFAFRDPKSFYPFHYGFMEEVGEGPGLGFNVNIPWPKKGAGDADYRVRGLRQGGHDEGK